MTEEFDAKQLQKSVNVVGYLYPILKTRSGKTLDGIHRKQIDPKWPEKIVDVESPYQEALIRLWANYRRRVSSEEVRQLIIQMAEELWKQGYRRGEIVKRLAEETPYSARRIQQILPKKFKRDYVKAEERLKPVEKLISQDQKAKCFAFESSDISVSPRGVERRIEEVREEAERQLGEVRRRVEEELEKRGEGLAELEAMLVRKRVSDMDVSELRRLVKLLMDRVRELSESFPARCPFCGREIWVDPETKSVGRELRA